MIGRSGDRFVLLLPFELLRLLLGGLGVMAHGRHVDRAMVSGR